jgi:membrane protein implicated in regulation of membrane protease activity
VATDFELQCLSAESTAASRQLFATIGMFMVLFGGMMLQALLGENGQPVAVLWSGLQKFGASIAVVIGVTHQIFSGLALLVAGFDFVSGILILLYWRALGDQS